MNKKGSFGLAVIYSIFFFLIGMSVVNILMPDVDNARASGTGMDCTNASISDGTKLSCLAVDTTIPYFIVLVVSGALGFIVERLTI